MSAGLVAGTVRARALTNRRLGFDAARRLACGPSLAAGVRALASSPYGPFVPPDPTLAQAQRAVAEALLWHLRVLAGWLPADGVRAVRLLAGWFELSNVDGHLAVLTGGGAEPAYRLGALATAWPRLARTGTLAQLRAALVASPWGDPGGPTVRDIQLGLRLSWADRVRSRVPVAADWARGAAALLAAREIFLTRQGISGRAARRLLGGGFATAGTVAGFAGMLPPATARLFDGITDPAELWRAELRWWARLRTEARALVVAGGFTTDHAVGTAALLAADAFGVRAALALAARGGTGVEDFDALA